MKYDFTSIMNRRGEDAIAVDAVGIARSPVPGPKDGFDAIPMWVADMNFPVFPGIQEAIAGRIQKAHFGYFRPRQEYLQAIIRWQETRNDVNGLNEDLLGYENGVLGGVISALNTLCSRGDNILLHSPTYVGFINSLTNNGYHMVLSPLVLDENGVWRMDYEDMEKKIVENNIHATVFCSPHNPCGRVWEKWELEKAFALFEKYDVKVVSDEIWSDIILNGHRHTPSQSVSDWARQNTVALYAPSKTFNLAGLVGSYHIIYNKTLRDRVDKESSLSHYNNMNVLSMYALIGAYCQDGGQWVDELRETLSGNVNYAYDYIKTHFRGVELARPEGTYMLFLDCSKWCEEYGKTIDQLQRSGFDVGVVWQDGRNFYGPCHIRMNLALPLTRVQEAMERLDRYVFNA
ncbi:MAG: aminotransferase class I/II-fold pyridoxal phosphate-dependent enzyme [Lachnospiraceae bacterium]|nr:aminotransferase class I/II-fold pyridoxal phosphate-dependent enzyme [Lachnospiraceae bacterium]